MKGKWKKGLSLFIVCALLLGLTPVGVVSADPAEDIDPQAQYYIINKATGKVLERTLDTSYVPGRNDVFRIVAGEPKESDNQKWILQKNGNNYRLINKGDNATGLHKTNESYSGIPGANNIVGVQNLAITTPQQQWTLSRTSEGYYTFLNIYNEQNNTYNRPQYLAVSNDIYTGITGARHIAATAESNTDAQLWTLEQVPGSGTPPLEPLPPFEPQEPLIHDALCQLPSGSVSLTGILDDAIRHVQNDELKELNWTKLVDQFRYKTDTDNRWRSEFWGKYMRGSAFIYSYTQDKDLYAMLEKSVKDLLTTQEANGRITSYPNDWGTWDIWGRKYVMLGLQSFYEICDDEALKKEILTAICYHADYMLDRLGPASDGKIPIVNTGYWDGIASCSILEPMVKLYNMTGFERYLDFSTYIVSTGLTKSTNIFELAYEGKKFPHEYFYNQAKAYEMTSCFEGLAEYYRVTGIEKWKTACLNYYNRACEAELTIAGSGGGVGRGADYSYSNPNGDEQWNNMTQNQTDPSIGQMQETCITVTWMKYCKQMLSLTGDASVADRLETSAYNALLAALKAEGVEVADYPFIFDYFTMLNGTKPNPWGGAIFENNGEPIGSCCSANGSSGMGIIPFIAVMQDVSGPVVNFYSAGSVDMKTPAGKALNLTLDTQYPKAGNVKITVTPEMAEEFAVKLRVPGWAKDGMTIKVNGQAQTGLIPGEYKSISRTWQAGDVIEIDFTMLVKTVQDPGGRDIYALQYGPVVLARDTRFGDGNVSAAVAVAKDKAGIVAATQKSSTFKSNVCFSIPKKDGGSFTVCDYASVGQTWSAESRFATWLPSTDFAGVKENVDYFIMDKAASEPAVAMGNGNIQRGTKPADGTEPPEQLWRFTKVGDYYKITSAANGQCVTALGTANQSNIVLADYTGADTQLWEFLAASGQYCKLSNKASGRLFSGAGESKNIHIWQDVGNDLQVWRLEACVQEPTVTAVIIDPESKEPVENPSFEKNAPITMRVVTPGDVTKLSLINENDMIISKRILDSQANGEDGTITWTVEFGVGTASADLRTVRIMTQTTEVPQYALTDGSITFMIPVPVPPAPLDPAVTSAAKTEAGTARVNGEFTVTVVTTNTVDKVKITNSGGSTIGILNKSVATAGTTKIWTLTIKIGSSGADRLFTVYAAPKGGDYVMSEDAFKTFAVTIVK